MFEGILGILIFFITCLALLGGLTAAGAALLTRRVGRAARIGLALAVWLAVYAAALLFFSLTSHPHSIPLGQERCFDEMCFTLQSVLVESTLPPAAAQGDFYILTIQLTNQAKRAAQRPSQPDLFILDAQGSSYSQMLLAADLPGGQRVGQPVNAGELWSEKVQPGQTVVRHVAFDLPAGVQKPVLVISEGVGPLAAVIIGDEASFLHARTRFELTP